MRLRPRHPPSLAQAQIVLRPLPHVPRPPGSDPSHGRIVVVALPNLAQLPQLRNEGERRIRGGNQEAESPEVAADGVHTMKSIIALVAVLALTAVVAASITVVRRM